MRRNTDKFYWMPKSQAMAISLDMDGASDDGRE